MPWNKSLELIQLQVSPEMKRLLKTMSKEDHRSLASEIVHLIELGIEKRTRIEQLASDDDGQTKPQEEVGSG